MTSRNVYQTSDDIEHLERVFKDASAEPIKIPYAVLKSITRNFSQEIGRGGFGVVYLGELQHGKVAVKKLSIQMDLSDKMFLDEVSSLMRLKHKNIVRFLGYCVDSLGQLMEVPGLRYQIAEELQRLLCFEYVPNGNIEQYLKDKSHGFEWNLRCQIIKGICQGLCYLHQSHIYHLDLKLENVLLGAGMEAKITDFGISRWSDSNTSTITTKNLVGTLGYMAPELIQKGQISFKADIYSLGIIIIKLLVGSNEADIDNWRKLLDGDCPDMNICIGIAQRCVDREPNNRPTIMEIVDQINATEPVIHDVATIINETKNVPECSLCQDLPARISSHLKESGLRKPSKQSVDVSYVPNLYTANAQVLQDIQELSAPTVVEHSRYMTENVNHTIISRIMAYHHCVWDCFCCCDRLISYSAQRRIKRTLIVVVPTVFVAAALVLIILRFALTPNVKANIDNARLDTFYLTTMKDGGSFLDYNMSTFLTIHNPNAGLTLKHTKPLVATFVFFDRRLENLTVLDKGQRQRPGRTTVVPLHAAGKVSSFVLGNKATEEFKNQNATGEFTVEVRLSGQVTYQGIVIAKYTKLSMSCELGLQVAPPGPEVILFQKVNCRAV